MTATTTRLDPDLVARIASLSFRSRRLLESMGRRGLVVIASDLLDQAAELPALLAQLRRRGHDVILFHTLDPAELTLPFDAPLLMESMEDDRRVLIVLALAAVILVALSMPGLAFGDSAFLVGVLSALLPLAIHLIGRQRATPHRFARPTSRNPVSNMPFP